MRTILVSAVLFLAVTVCFAANHYIRPGASGNGSDWANAYGQLPAQLVRGDTYYLADGEYPAYTFDDAVGGNTNRVTIKKATVPDHGTDTGWQAAFGDGQAKFPGIVFTKSYYIIDGVTGKGQGDETYGICIYNDTGPAYVNDDYIPPRHTLIKLMGNASHITLKHVEATRTSDKHMGSAVSATDQASSPAGKNTDILVSHCYFHDLFGVFFYLYGDEDITIENTYMVRNRSSAAWHAEAMQCRGVNNMTIRYSWFEDIMGTAVIVCGSLHSKTWKIYGNVFYNNPGAGAWGHAHVGYNAGGANNTLGDVHFYNNTCYGAFSKSGVRCNGSSPSYAYNNYFYNCSGLYWGGITHQYNAYNKSTFVGYNPGAYAHPGPTDQCGDVPDTQNKAAEVEALAGSYIGVLFADGANGDLRLTAPTADGKSLAVAYTLDPNGLTRGEDGVWDRGAFEYSKTNIEYRTPNVECRITQPATTINYLRLYNLVGKRVWPGPGERSGVYFRYSGDAIHKAAIIK